MLKIPHPALRERKYCFWKVNWLVGSQYNKSVCFPHCSTVLAFCVLVALYIAAFNIAEHETYCYRTGCGNHKHIRVCIFMVNGSGLANWNNVTYFFDVSVLSPDAPVCVNMALESRRCLTEYTYVILNHLSGFGPGSRDNNIWVRTRTMVRLLVTLDL